MRPTSILALLLLAGAAPACDPSSPTRDGGPPAAVTAVVGFYQLASVQGMDVPAEVASPTARCDEREPYHNPAGPRVGGELVAAFFDGALELGTTPQRQGHYLLSLSIRTTCEFGDGHQELEDQLVEEGGFVVDDASGASFLLRSPLSEADGYTHLEAEMPSMEAVEGGLNVRARINGVDMILRFRRAV